MHENGITHTVKVFYPVVSYTAVRQNETQHNKGRGREWGEKTAMATLSPPLGDPIFGAQNGINWHALPPEGNAAAKLLQRAFMAKTGERISTDITGNFKAILAAKDVCNDIMTVFLGNDKSLMFTPLGQAFNISLAHHLNVKRIYDQISMVVTGPAQRTSKGTRPTTATSFCLERTFSKNQRDAMYEFPGEVVNAVEKLRTRIASFNPLGGPETELSDDWQAVERHRNAVAEEILDELSECFKVPAFCLKNSFEQGVVDEALMTLIDTSIPYALALVTDKYARSIVEGASPGDWENNLQIQNSLCKEYALESTKSVYLLCKSSPETVFTDLINKSLKHIENIAHTHSNAIVYDPSTNGVHKLEGIIHLGSQAFDYVMAHPVIAKKQLKSGIMMDSKLTYLKPAASLMKGNTIQSPVMLNENEKHTKDAKALDEVVKTIREKNGFPTGQTQGKGVIRLSELGRELLAGKKIEDGEARMSTRSRYELGLYAVEEPCTYVLHGGSAFIIDQARNYRPNHDSPDPCGRSPSLVSLRHTLFRVTMGDLNACHDQFSRWISLTVMDPAKASTVGVEPHELFSVKSVVMHTPGLSPQRLTFGSNELRTAFMDPALYDATKQEEAMNCNVSNLDKRSEADLNFMKNLFLTKLTAAKNAEELFKTYYCDLSAGGELHNRSKNALSVLQSIQLNPFFDVRTQDAGSGKTKFKFEKRDLCIQVPLYEMVPEVVHQRGLFFLAKAARENELYNLNRKLSDYVRNLKKDQYPMDPDEQAKLPAELTDIAASLAAMFKKVFVRSSYTPQEINFLFTPCKKTSDSEGEKLLDNWFILKYVLFPILAEGQLAFGTKKGKPDVNLQGYTGEEILLDKDVVQIKEDATEFNIFDADDLFPKNYMMSANTNWVVRKNNWPPILQAAVLMMQYCKLTPTAMCAIITEDCPPGFSVDFIRHEAIYSEQAIVTKVGTHEMILSPGGVTEHEKGDGSIDIMVSGDIYTTRNTLGAGAVLVPCVYPNRNAMPRAQNAAGNPIITQDHLTRTEYGTLANWLAQSSAFTKTDKKVITNQLGITTRHRNVYSDAVGGLKARYPDEFVPVIRPVSKPHPDILPIMGREKFACMPVVGSSNSTWESFYTSREPSQNPYAGEMGGLYALRYTKDNTPILPGSRSMLLRTTDVQNGEVPCSATVVLEELYDMSYTLPVLTPHERSIMTAYSVRAQGNTGDLHYKTYSNIAEATGQPLIGKMDVPAAMGFSVPYTQSTNPTLLSNTRYSADAISKTLKGPNDSYILSPYTVPE